MRKSKRVVAACLIVVMGVPATGCQSWRAVAEPVPAAVARYPNRRIQVVDQGGRTSTADSARVGADAILAFHRDLTDTIPLTQVQAVKLRQPSTGRTIGLVAGIILVPFVAVLAAWGIECGGSNRCY